MVQAYCFSKYMGRLKVNVDKRGSMLPVNIFLYQDGFFYIQKYFAERLVVPVEGAGISEAEVILLDHTVKQDEETLKMMEPYEYEDTASAPFLQKMIVLQTNLGSFWPLTTRPWAGPT